MSEDLRSEAWQLLEQTQLQIQRGQYTDALTTLSKAEQLARKAEAPDILSAVLGTTARVLQSKGMFNESLKLYTAALNIQEELAKINPFFNTWVATTLNNLGALLSDMGRPEEAKTRYERALEIYEALLATDPASSVYQSWVATTLNNLGTLLSDMGNKKGALGCYQKSLDIFIEPMQYLTIKAKARAIINIIQLVSGCAQECTNMMRKSKYFKKVHDVYKQHAPFFSKYELVHEGRLAKEAGLSAHIQYLMLNAGSEGDKEKRIEEYETCIREVEQIAETEDDENLKELWLSIMYYLKGRQFVNLAMQSEPPDTELMKKAIEQFKSAKDRYSQANVCYCIYTVLLELESIEVLDDENVSRLNKLLKNATKSLPEIMDDTVKSAFHEIEVLLDDRNLKTDPKMFERLNTCITKIDYYAMREYFNHISCKIRKYLEEPFSPEVKYSNWTLHIKLDEPEKVQGVLTIKAGDRTLFDAPLEKTSKLPYEFAIPSFYPQTKKETLIFTDQKRKRVKRYIEYSEKISYKKGDKGTHDTYFTKYDCKRPDTEGMFKIAIVQLKYRLNKISSTLVIDDDKAYHNKIVEILKAVRGKANIIVFPEFSIPFEYLGELQKYSDDTGICIVAGSHYVTANNIKKYNEIFHDDIGKQDLLKNISPVIIPSSKKILHTEKILPAKEERKLFNEEGMENGTLNRVFKLNNNVTFGVMICFDFINTELQMRFNRACNIILVPQANPGTERFHNIGESNIINTDGEGNKTYIMASAIFTYNDGKEGIMGGNSGAIPTLDKASFKKGKDTIIKPIKVGKDKVHEQFIQLASLDMGFITARDAYTAQTPITYNLIHIFEKNEILKSGNDGKNPTGFLELLDKIKSCDDEETLIKLLMDNESLIYNHSPLMHKMLIQKPSWYEKKEWDKKTNPEKIKENLENLTIEKINKKCANIVVDML